MSDSSPASTEAGPATPVLGEQSESASTIPPTFTGDNDGRTYEFVLQDGRPVKVGDGSFGSVFHVIDERKTNLAAKLFYATQDESLLARFREEMNALDSIHKGLEECGLPPEFSVNLVLPQAWTERFIGSNAHTRLNDLFSSTHLSLCGLVAVMPLYKCTLKEVLERGAPANRLAGSTMVKEPGERGYDILDKMSCEERVAALLPIARNVALGLRALHAANFSHHDLKPANVLVRSTGSGLEFAVSDFGFLKPNESASTNLRHVGASAPAGTRHYRSNEQRDYFDVCEVDVEVGADERVIILTTLDRKFKEDSIIEKGDTVSFFKDPGAIYTITEIDRNASPVKISIRNNQKVPPASDQKTQAIFYKSQTLRTDLFGLGALMFDLLTAGRSPEKFSDYLRSKDGSELPIDTLEERYRSYKDSSSGESELVAW